MSGLQRVGLTGQFLNHGFGGDGDAESWLALVEWLNDQAFS